MSTVLAVLAALAVFTGLVTAVLGLVNAHRIRKTATDVQQITVSVDGQMSGLLLRVDQLISAMHDQGAIVPAPPTTAAVAEAVKAKNEAGERLGP